MIANRMRKWTLAVTAGVLLVSAAAAQAAVAKVPLIEAVKAGDVATVKALIAKKVDINAAEPDGTTALHWAAFLDDATVVDLLIKAGAHVTAVTRNGATAFGLACEKGNPAAIQRLVAA